MKNYIFKKYNKTSQKYYFWDVLCFIIFLSKIKLSSATEPNKTMYFGLIKSIWEFKKLKQQINLDEEEIKNQEKQIEELKNEIGYKIVTQMSREEYERRCRIWELERNNKLANTKYYFDNNEITLEKYLTIGQKKRR